MSSTEPSFRVLPLAQLIRHRRILDRLLVFPGRALTIRQLSKESGVPYATTWRLVEDLRSLGAVRMRRVGQAQLISMNLTSPLVPDLKKILGLRLSPHRAAAERFARLASRVKEVRKVILFGSVAQERAGVHSDVDVAVVLRPTRRGVADEIYRLAAKVQDETGLALIPIRISPEELEADSDFARALRAGELLYERA